ncbi:MAG: (2Fe-2S)-binding protein, partial [Pseudomonadota bacterium]
MDISLRVNGSERSGSVEGRTLLVEFLRTELGLTGTHVGCDTSQCGACVVHVDGVAVKACTMLAAEAAGSDVTTIEGMANPDGSLGTIQQAFQDHHGLQCGFCTPGMVMSAAALLKENPQPSEAEIREYL